MPDLDVLDRLLADRWSCRGFTEEPVDPATIERLLLAAQRSPSWCNTQPWRVVVTSGDEPEKLRDAIAADNRIGSDIPFPQAYEGVYAARRRESGWQLYEAVGIAKGDRAASAVQMMKNFEFFGAPHVAIVSTTAVDGGAAADDGVGPAVVGGSGRSDGPTPASTWLVSGEPITDRLPALSLQGGPDRPTYSGTTPMQACRARAWFGPEFRA